MIRIRQRAPSSLQWEVVESARNGANPLAALGWLQLITMNSDLGILRYDPFNVAMVVFLFRRQGEHVGAYIRRLEGKGVLAAPACEAGNCRSHRCA